MRSFAKWCRAGVGASIVCFASSSRADEPSHDLPAARPATERLTRSRALELLKSENLALLAARHRLSQARAEVIAAGVWTNPNINATSVLLTHGAVTGGRTEVVATVDQVLPLAGQVGLRKDVARASLSAEERAFAATAWQLGEDAKVAYLELQRAEGRVRLVENGLADFTRVETIVTERTAAGASSAYDRIRVGVERSKLEARRAQAEVDLASARTLLAEAIGRSIDARTVMVEGAIEEPADPPRDVEALVRRAVVSRPEVGSARARAEAAEIRVAYLRRQYVPSPDLSVGYARYIDVPGSGGASGGAFVAGVSLPIPVLDHGQGTIDRGRAAAAEEHANRDAVELGVRRQVEQACTSLAIRVDAWRKFRDTTAPNLSRLRGSAEVSYREGRATILELLDAYSAFLDGEERSLDHRAAAARSALELERAVGP